MSCSVKFFEPTVSSWLCDMQEVSEASASAERNVRRSILTTMPRQQLLATAEQPICGQSHQRGGNCARQNDSVIDHRDSAKDEFAQSAGADRRRNGRYGDRDLHRVANSGKHDWQHQRQLDMQKQLSGGEPHGGRCFANWLADSGDADVSV